MNAYAIRCYLIEEKYLITILVEQHLRSNYRDITTSMLGLAIVTGGHDEASGKDEKLPVLRGMMIVLSRSFL